MSETKPGDLLDEVYGEGAKKRHQANIVPVDVEKHAAKIDGGVRTIEEKLTYWQEIGNEWRKAIVQNEHLISAFWFLFGMIYSYAINKCTGSFVIPGIAYLLSGIILVLLVFLMISEESLPLLSLIKIGLYGAFGHIMMMTAVAVDGHTWNLFTSDVCRYPFSSDSLMIYMLGMASGIVFDRIIVFRNMRTVDEE